MQNEKDTFARKVGQKVTFSERGENQSVGVVSSCEDFGVASDGNTSLLKTSPKRSKMVQRPGQEYTPTKRPRFSSFNDDLATPLPMKDLQLKSSLNSTDRMKTLLQNYEFSSALKDALKLNDDERQKICVSEETGLLKSKLPQNCAIPRSVENPESSLKPDSQSDEAFQTSKHDFGKLRSIY